MEEIKRSGDKISIEGDYQDKALHHGIVFQRSWHRLKLKSSVRSLSGSTGQNILDIGCGSGTLIQFLPDGYESYTGIDINPEAIGYCRNRYPGKRHEFLMMEFDHLPGLEQAAFSHIFFLESIEHVTKHQGLKILNACKHLLTDDGRLIITTPNRKSAWPLIEKLLDSFGLTPTLANEQHEHLYTIRELKNLASEAGLMVKNCFTINGIAPWLSFLGKKITDSIHEWECRNNWFPGSIMVMELGKGPVTD